MSALSALFIRHLFLIATQTRSFVRQLNYHGFSKLRYDITRGIPEGWLEFRHSQFIRHKPELRVQIQRKSATDNCPQANETALARVQVLEQLLTTLTNEVREMNQRIVSLEHSKMTWHKTMAASVMTGSKRSLAPEAIAPPPAISQTITPGE